MRKLTVGSLFAGIGGFDLGLERSGGFEVVWQVEKDPYCQQVLAKHWPNIVRYGDIYECGKGRKYPLPTVDVLCGGFPCQPHSLAGKRQASEDERDLWPEFCRIIRELKPRWILGENVLGLLSSEDGRFFGEVLRDLAEAGYDAEWVVLRASDVGAPHQRERVFIVAYPSSQQSQRGRDVRELVGSTGTGQGNEEEWQWIWNTTHDSGEVVADTSRSGRQELNASPITGASGHIAGSTHSSGATGLPESRICRDIDGISAGMDRYQWPARPGEQQHGWEPPRIVADRQRYRVAQLRALGNAIVPQCAEYVARCVLAYEAQREQT